MDGWARSLMASHGVRLPLEGARRVDAVIGDAPPGTIHHFDHDEVLSLAHRAATVHHLGLSEGLRWILHAHPEMNGVCFSLWGVEPETLSPVEALSEAVEEAVRRLANEIFVAIQNEW